MKEENCIRKHPRHRRCESLSFLLLGPERKRIFIILIKSEINRIILRMARVEVKVVNEGDEEE